MSTHFAICPLGISVHMATCRSCDLLDWHFLKGFEYRQNVAQDSNHVHSYTSDSGVTSCEDERHALYETLCQMVRRLPSAPARTPGALLPARGRQGHGSSAISPPAPLCWTPCRPGAADQPAPLSRAASIMALPRRSSWAARLAAAQPQGWPCRRLDQVSVLRPGGRQWA